MFEPRKQVKRQGRAPRHQESALSVSAQADRGPAASATVTRRVAGVEKMLTDSAAEWPVQVLGDGRGPWAVEERHRHTDHESTWRATSPESLR